MNKMSGMNKCGLTMTGTRARYKCALRQVQAHGVALHQILCRTFVPSGGVLCRSAIKSRIKDSAVFVEFQKDLRQQCPDLWERICSTIRPYISLMGLDSHRISNTLDTVELCDWALWIFCIRILYQRPCLAAPDSPEGSHVEYLQASLKCFISEQVVLPTGGLLCEEVVDHTRTQKSQSIV